MENGAVQIYYGEGHFVRLNYIYKGDYYHGF